MRAQEFICEDKQLPDIIYHGTPSKNLTNILRRGLQPRYNKWETQQYKLYTPQNAKRSADDQPVLSTTPDLDLAIQYAQQGGSTGVGQWEGERNIVLAFKPLPTDKYRVGGHMASHEIEFYNTISPDRLSIVWPEAARGKLTPERMAAAQSLNTKQASKTELVKAANKHLQKIGSPLKIASIGTANRPRIRVKIKNTPGTPWYSSDYRTPYIDFVNYNPERNSWDPVEFDITSTEFQNWLSQQTATPPITDKKVEDQSRALWDAMSEVFNKATNYNLSRAQIEQLYQAELAAQGVTKFIPNVSKHPLYSKVLNNLEQVFKKHAQEQR
jgi:hypothetical protein